MRIITPGKCLTALSGGITFLSSIQILTISLSLAQIQISQGAALGILLLSIVAGFLAGCFLEETGSFASVPEPTPGAAFGLTGTLTLFAFLVYFLSWFVALVAPERSWDGLSYHLPTIHLWARKGHLDWIDPRFPLSPLMNGYPKGVELVSFVMVEAFRSDRMATTSNLLYVLLAVLGIAYLSTTLGATPKMALFAGSAFLLVPVVEFQSITTYTDVAYSASAIAFFAALAYVLSRLGASSCPPWRAIPMLGGAIGLMLGAKASSWALAGTGLGVAWIACLFILPRVGSRVASSLFLSLALACGLSTGGYWYLRNWLKAGSPLYPVGVAVAGHDVFPGLAIPQAIRQEINTPDFMKPWSAGRRVFNNWTQGWKRWPGTILGVDSREGGLGYLWLLGCLPSMGLIVFRCVRQRGLRARLQPTLVAGIAAGIGFVVTPMNWWARYTVWIYGLGLPCFAWALSEIIRSARSGRLPRIWLVACLSLLVYEGGRSEYVILGRAYPGPRPLHPVELLRPANWRWKSNYVFPETRGTIFDEIVASHDAVALGPACREEGCLASRSLVLGQLSYPIGGRDIVPLTGPVDSEAAAELRARRVRFVIWGAEQPPDLGGNLSVLETLHVSGFWVVVLRESVHLPES
ncbi:MAG TPA: hypothetical protein VGV60_12935 [Candidatus Polarisedimenticolia bacterium]|nr:hypothetical protein [Candidatus Polarisedimenticolia bacterium]